MKKILAIIILAAMFTGLVACGVTPAETTSSDEATTASTEGTTAQTEETTAQTEGTTAQTEGTTAQTEGTTASTESTTASTEETTADDPHVDPTDYVRNDPIMEKVGKYVTVMYNPAYCTVTGTASSGLGSRENVTLTIEMNDGYTFYGWSDGKALVSGGTVAKRDTTYKFTASSDVIIYANYSVTVTYHANGGTAKTGGDTYDQKYSVVWYKCPMTLPENGYFTREGYTLSEYNTKADGSGTAISLGSRVFMDDKGTIDLYCIWEKQSDESDFTYTVSDNKATITKYKGSDDTVVIPDKLGGANVKTIASGAFNNAKCTKVILSKNVTTVEDNAFANSAVTSLVIFDSLMSISDRAFTGGTLKSLRINASLGLFNNWMQNQTTTKLDRLVYATSKGLKSIVMYGGSGSINGFDCVQIDEALGGEYCIINVGSNANASAAFFFDWFEDLITSDDIILWVPEIGNYMLGDTWFSDRLWGLVSGHYDAFKDVDISEFTNVFGAYSSYAATHAGAQTTDYDAFPTYQDANGNRLPTYSVYGDNMAPREHIEKPYNYGFNVYPTSYFYMSDLIERITGAGTKIYFSYAAMDASGGNLTDANFEQYTNKLMAAFPQIKIIADYKASLVPHELFYDSEWHLTWEGAVYRTRQIVPYIVAQVEKDK